MVLINEGQSYKQLLEECATLSDSGFTVFILNGGLYQWRQKGGPLEGDVFAQRELNKISPQTFFTGKNHENWVLVDVSQSGKPEADLQNLNGIHIPYVNSPEEFISKLESATGGKTDKDFVSVLII